MAANIAFEPIPGDFHTAYLKRGDTRHPHGNIAHIDSVLTVRRAPSHGWRLSRGALAALLLLEENWVREGGEPLRLTDATREVTVQTSARAGYQLWLDSGKPAPTSPRWRPAMKTAYVAPPDGSFHQCGLAVDLDVGALFFEGRPRGRDCTLAKLWEIAMDIGWTPVIRHPVVDQSEAWHFDHMGGLSEVYEHLSRSYRGAYTETARIGCALAGTLAHTTRNRDHRYVQARLSVAGFFCGVADGIVGPKTLRALEQADAPMNLRAKATRSPQTVVGWMNETELGTEAIANL